MMGVKMTSAIRKAVGDEAADDFELLMGENILTKTEFQQGISQLKGEFEQKTLQLDQKISQTREDFLRAIMEVRDEIRRSHVSLIRWIVVVFIVSGGLYYFLR